MHDSFETRCRKPNQQVEVRVTVAPNVPFLSFKNSTPEKEHLFSHKDEVGTSIPSLRS